jgi:PPM family protein phosphatase
MAAPSSHRLVSTSERLYRIFLQIYPHKFRQIYGQEMVQTFRDCCRDALHVSGSRGLLQLWSLVLYDLAITACAEHIRAVIALLKHFLGVEKEYTMLDNLLHLDVALCTDVGRKRAINEDSMTSVIPEDPQILAKKGALFVVADGMGGHAHGEVASQIAVSEVSSAYYQDDDEDIASALSRAVRHANNSIYQQVDEEDKLSHGAMGTTCIAAVIHDNIAYIANVGDSRAYIVHQGQVRLISQDHSWVAEQVRAGLLTEEQARTHIRRNVITRCLGTQADVEVDVFIEQVQEGDALILCTDGLSGLVDDDELCVIVEQYGPQDSVSRLIECANERGGHDNITAIVARVGYAA